jgi:phosphohistidine phosphatase
MMMLMQIYLLRHGIAESTSTSGADADRDLTAEGRHGVKAIAKLAAKAGVKPSLVISSPYKRALRTARIAAEVFESSHDILQSAALTPGSSLEPVWDEIRTHRDEQSIMLVGHEPLFSALGAYLLDAPELTIDFKKAAILCVEMEAFGTRPGGTLKWMLTPKFAE